MKKAFTMIELVVVMVVVGILVAVALPRMNQDNIYQAANQVASHLRYTQHLAMQDDKFNPADSTWYRTRWQMIFSKSNGTDKEWAYTVFSDMTGNHTGNPDASEIAVNPQNPSQRLTGGYTGSYGPTILYGDARITKSMNIGHKYGIKYVYFRKCGPNGSRRLAFDNFGRPITGNLASKGIAQQPYVINRVLSKEPCEIWLCTVDKEKCKKEKADETEIIKIAIEPETGYVHIL